MMTTTRPPKSLPELLLAGQLVDAERLQAAQATAASLNVPLKRVLIQQGLLSEEQLLRTLAEQFGMATVDVAAQQIKPEVLALVPEALARKHTVMPVFAIAGTLTVAVDDPLNFAALDDIRARTKCEVKVVLAGETAIRQAIDRHYGQTAPSGAAAAPAGPRAATAGHTLIGGEDASAIELVDRLVEQALQDGASDIHLEPAAATLRTRFRVDGILREIAGPAKSLQVSLVSRIKVLANLDIAEKRKPQDGSLRLTVHGREIDVRVSVVPTGFGEKVVLRLLDRSSLLLGLEQLGMTPDMLETFRRLIRSPHGILLVTGPTGAGKTTTLYAALQAINSVDKNIITIEDPIEYQLPGVTQVQVNPKAEVTFASALRSFLRQDPDVIMVGEIRDRETAETAIQSALTGHLVLSTLHTNDACGALTRLTDMGIEPFLIASSVIGVLAQRLVRTVCPNCKTADHPPAGLALPHGAKPMRGAGCSACRRSGYKGRLAIFELLAVSDAIRAPILARAASHVIREGALRGGGMTSLRDDGLQKAGRGLTTIEEVLRVTQLEEP